MAIKLFDAVGIISVNAKGLEKGMKRARKLVKSGFGAIVRIAKTAAKVAAVALAAIAIAAAAVGVKILKMGADAEESENLFEVSMGNMADAARKWSIQLSEALGLNQFEVRKTIGVFNQMFTAMGVGTNAAFEMSKGLTELAADMASFFNISQEEAFEKLSAGITGEIEPLKRLGIVLTVAALESFALSRGITKSVLSMTEAEKVALRYNFILQQTVNAQGDLARTADSVTNRLRTIMNAIAEVGTQIGMAFQPALKELLGPIAEAANATKAWAEDNKLGFEVLGLQIVGIGRLLLGQLLPSFDNLGEGASEALFNITGALDKLIVKLLELEEGELLEKIQQRFQNFVGQFDTPLFNAIGAGLSLLVKQTKESGEKLADVFTVLDAGLGAVKGDTDVAGAQVKAVWEKHIKKMKEGTAEKVTGIAKLFQILKGVVEKSFGDTSDRSAVAQLARRFFGLNDVVGAAQKAFRGIAIAFSEAGRNARNLEGSLKAVKAAFWDLVNLNFLNLPFVPSFDPAKDIEDGPTGGSRITNTFGEVKINVQGGKDDADTLAQTILNLLLDLGDAGKMNRAGTQVMP